MKIIFQDIDGPLIPYRMYIIGDRLFDSKAQSFIYDPIAVGMLNNLCEKLDAKIVFNSAHNENTKEVMMHQASYNGLKFMHHDCITNFPKTSRLKAIFDWLQKHPETVDWIVIDDMDVATNKQVKVDYEIGMTLNNYIDAYKLLNAGIGPEILTYVSNR